MVAMAEPGEVLRGRAVILDGDTLSLRGRVLGLQAINAHGLTQTCLDGSGRSYACGKVAARALAARVGDAVITCELRQPDPHGRIAALCRKDGEDLSAWMVHSGYAISDSGVPAAYAADAKSAWAKRAGLWAGVFEDPSSRPRDAHAAAGQIAAAQAKVAAAQAPDKRARVGSPETSRP